MLIREVWERLEAEHLSPFAALSAKSKGRERIEKECDIRTTFQRDRDRILHSKAFRRLKHKTQVFLAPSGDHYRTRLTHTLEVSQISRTVARALRLNEDLTEAIALGHDLGHTPFGHAGEEVLNELLPEGFRHNEQSLRVVDKLEKNGQGLNLTYEVKDGILKHSKLKEGILAKIYGERPATLEGEIVMVCDSVAYINHDIDDAIRAGLIKESDLPPSCVKLLGDNHSARINTMVRDIVENSLGKSEIQMSSGVLEETDKLRSFLFEMVYLREEVQREIVKAKTALRDIFEYLLAHPGPLPQEFYERGGEERIDRIVCDFIAGMTDRYALIFYEKLFLPQPWRD